MRLDPAAYSRLKSPRYYTRSLPNRAVIVEDFII
jgi:hypothetical protein